MKRRSKADLRALLVDLGLTSGDRVYVAAFIPAIGVVEEGLAGLYEAVRDVVGGGGTIIVPAFTASYRRDEIFDVRESSSFNGAFSEYLRRLDGAERSLDPLFSMAATGPDSKRLMARRTKNCFGKGSVFETLFDNDVKFAGLGVDWDQGYSFFMHLERLAGVPFRREQSFSGRTRDASGRLFDDEAVHFVRVDDVPWRRNRSPACRELVKDGVVREVVLSGCPFRLFESERTASVMAQRYANDPWYMTDRSAT